MPAMSRRPDRRAVDAAPRLPLTEPPPGPTFARERAALRRGVWPVAGCDEAGRGGGPVVVAEIGVRRAGGDDERV
ncbi:hypothetical protein CH340_17540, partial [Rhodoplanes serenus]